MCFWNQHPGIIRQGWHSWKTKALQTPLFIYFVRWNTDNCILAAVKIYNAKCMSHLTYQAQVYKSSSDIPFVTIEFKLLRVLFGVSLCVPKPLSKQSPIDGITI